jgi:N-acyl-D-amino-acid deacylase
MLLPNKGYTRREMIAQLAGITGLAAAEAGALPAFDTPAMAQAPPAGVRPPDAAIPITGKAGPGLELFDRAMLAIMDRHGVPGAALALARNGKLVLAKGYGWANAATGEPVEPSTLFGLASVTKPFTAVAAMMLIEQGKFGLDDPALPLIPHIQPPPGVQVDPRLMRITVRQCLNHSGGWDRTVTGDPINWEPQICRAFRIRPPVSPRQFLSFVLGMPLQFDPGTNSEYSNTGFVILGEIIATVSGKPYGVFVKDHVLKPMEITRPALHPLEGRYMPEEAHRHLAGSLTPLPPMNTPMLDATGGWSGSVVDLARFLTNLDGSRGKPVLGEKWRRAMLESPPPPHKQGDGSTHFGLGWDMVAVTDKGFGCSKEGSLQGMRTLMRRLITGTSWALLYNASMEFDQLDSRIAASTVQEVRALVERIEHYPDVDLFKEFP